MNPFIIPLLSFVAGLILMALGWAYSSANRRKDRGEHNTEQMAGRLESAREDRAKDLKADQKETAQGLATEFRRLEERVRRVEERVGILDERSGEFRR